MMKTLGLGGWGLMAPKGEQPALGFGPGSTYVITNKCSDSR